MRVTSIGHNSLLFPSHPILARSSSAVLSFPVFALLWAIQDSFSIFLMVSRCIKVIFVWADILNKLWTELQV